MLFDRITKILKQDWNQLSPEEITLIRDKTHYLEEFFVVGSLSKTVFGIGRVHMEVYWQSREGKCK